MSKKAKREDAKAWARAQEILAEKAKAHREKIEAKRAAKKGGANA